MKSWMDRGPERKLIQGKVFNPNRGGYVLCTANTYGACVCMCVCVHVRTHICMCLYTHEDNPCTTGEGRSPNKSCSTHDFIACKWENVRSSGMLAQNDFSKCLLSVKSRAHQLTETGLQQSTSWSGINDIFIYIIYTHRYCLYECLNVGICDLYNSWRKPTWTGGSWV